MSRLRRAGASILLTVLLAFSACSGSDGAAPDPSSPSSVATDATTPADGSSATETAEPSTASSLTAPSGTTSTTAAPTTSTVPPPDGLAPLIAGHNDLSADRINLILAPWGWDDFDTFRDVAWLYLGWDQRAQLVNDDGYPVSGADRAGFAELGLFGIEPYRSNRDKFNVWITDVSPPGPAVWLNSEDLPFALPDQSIVTLAKDPDQEFPGISSLAGQDTAFSLQEIPARTGTDSVANAMIFVRSSFPASAMLDLPHELGHALFGLADEYVGRVGLEEPGEPRVDIWPSCAANIATAERWWGDLLGEYDPMIDVWASEMTAAGFSYLVGDIEELRDLVRIDYVEDGCFGDPGSIRATEDSLMGFNQPAFGLANRRAAENILELWEG